CFPAFGVRRSGSVLRDPLAFAQLCVLGADAALAIHMVRRGYDRVAIVVLGLSCMGMAAARSRTAVAAWVLVAGFAVLHAFAIRWSRRNVPMVTIASVTLAVCLVVAVPHVTSGRQDPVLP